MNDFAVSPTAPLYTQTEAACFLDVPAGGFRRWVCDLLITVAGKGVPNSITFVGLAEGMVLAAFRRAGLGPQKICEAVAILERELEVDNPLVHQYLRSHGPAILYEQFPELALRRRTFAPVVRKYLDRIRYSSDGWANRVVSPRTTRPVVVADIRRAFGQPIFIRGGAPVQSVISRLKAGERIEHVARDFRVPANDVRLYLYSGSARPINYRLAGRKHEHYIPDKKRIPEMAPAKP